MTSLVESFICRFGSEWLGMIGVGGLGSACKSTVRGGPIWRVLFQGKEA